MGVFRNKTKSTHYPIPPRHRDYHDPNWKWSILKMIGTITAANLLTVFILNFHVVRSFNNCYKQRSWINGLYSRHIGCLTKSGNISDLRVEFLSVVQSWCLVWRGNTNYRGKCPTMIYFLRHCQCSTTHINNKCCVLCTYPLVNETESC